MSDDTLTGELEQEAINSIADAAVTEQEVKDYFNDLVGEDKKYKSPQDLAKAYIHADLHIRELRDKLDDLQSNDDLLKEVLQELKTKPTQNDPPAPANSPAPADRSDDVDIGKIVSEELNKRQQQEAAKRNRDLSLSMLDKYYGSRDKALEAIRAKINGNDVVKEVINKLGDTAPEEAFRYITGEAPGTDHTSDTGQPNTPGVTSGPSAHTLVEASSKFTWSYCQELRKKDPKTYNSPEFRAKIERAVAAAERNGKDFFAT